MHKQMQIWAPRDQSRIGSVGAILQGSIWIKKKILQKFKDYFRSASSRAAIIFPRLSHKTKKINQNMKQNEYKNPYMQDCLNYKKSCT